MNIQNVYILEDRGILYINGADAEEFLQNMISNDINRVNEDNSCFASLLSPQGKFLFAFIIVKHKSGYFIDCEKPQTEALFKQLSIYKLRSKVEIMNLSNEFVVAAFNREKFLKFEGAKDAPIPDVANLTNCQAASISAGSSDVETIMTELPPAGRPIGVCPIPGYLPVLSSKSPLARSMEPTADVDQKYIATSPELNGTPASPADRLGISHSRKSNFICSSAAKPASPPKLTFPSLRIDKAFLN